MKINLHIVQRECEGLARGARLPADNHLSLLGMYNGFPAEGSFFPDTLYVVEDGTADYHAAAASNAQLLVVSARPPDEVLREVRGYCLVLDAQGGYAAACSRVADIFNRYHRWETSIERAIRHGVKLDCILELGFELIGNPMALCDPSFFCMATCKKELAASENSVWKTIDTPGQSYISLNALLRSNKLLDRVRTETSAFVYRLPGDKEHVMHLNIYSDRKRIAYLVSIDTLQPFDNYSCSVADLFGQLLSSALNATTKYEHEHLSNIDLISRRILANEHVNEAHLQLMLDQVGWKKNDSYCVCEIEPINSDVPFDALSDITLFQMAMSDSAAFYYRTGIAVVRNLTRSRQSYKEFGAQIEDFIRKSQYLGGISDVFHDYGELRFFETEARAALNAAKAKLHHSQNLLVYYGDCMLENMLHLYEDSFDLRSICRPDIYQLWQYSRKHKNAYIDCLYVYLSTGKNLVESARRMFIHRNTFVYRLNKIISLIGEEAFQGDDSTLEMLLSCKVISYMERHQKEQTATDDGE